ncbi:hypothetical protein [Halovivax asiaticus]|uniref:hypothetical protein n=1 Tax=Halovivax asiaticus TaxID=332953 RepID=UPI0012672950|nr:hypothetical protein [Halovivax asiaticus]
MTGLGSPDASTLTRRRREKRTDFVIELSFGEPLVSYSCPGCGTEALATLLVPTDEPTFGNCSNWDCDAFLKFIHDGGDSNGSAGHNRPLGAFATDGGRSA